jgi:tRNA (cmo5U34)-methyltransferase
LRNCRLKTARLPISPQAQTKLSSGVAQSAIAVDGAKIAGCVAFTQTYYCILKVAKPDKHPGKLFFSQLRSHYFIKKTTFRAYRAGLVVICLALPFFSMAAMPLSPVPASPPDADFGPVAWFYDALAGLVFGGALRRAQRATLAAGLPAGPAPRVLVLGGGAGWVLGEIWRQRPQAQVLYLEVSAAMLARTRARLRHNPPPTGATLELRQGTEASLLPDEKFDVLITFFVLDCFTEAALPGALAQLYAARHPSTPWLVTDFRPAQWGWRRWLLQAMYLFFGLTVGLRARQLPPWPAALAALGLHPRWSQDFFGSAITGIVLNGPELKTEKID